MTSLCLFSLDDWPFVEDYRSQQITNTTEERKKKLRVKDQSQKLKRLRSGSKASHTCIATC